MLNKLVHETRGKCWHELAQLNPALSFWHCSKCKAPGPTNPAGKNTNPDYENDMNACMEMLDETIWELGSHGKGSFAWIDGLFAEGETPNLAIIHAYLKSKGVELGESE